MLRKVVGEAHLLNEDTSASIEQILIPRRFDIRFDVDGLRIVRLSHSAQQQAVQLTPYKSRGEVYRRVLASQVDGRQYVVEFVSNTEVYEPPILGAIRARDYTINGNVLELKGAQFRDSASALGDFLSVHEIVRDAWISGIRYRREVVDGNGNIVQAGLRVPQIGALHAIAAHWTLGKEPAIVVMPTGTGKTEVMIAAAIAAQSSRVLIVVPSDPLRHQTAEKFISYGLLERLGILDALPNPVVGVLSSKPTAAHLEAIKACNIVVTTMSSIGLAEEPVQKQFASLFSHIFFDEAHHIEAASWRRFRKCCGDAHVLMFTATPFREDGKPLDGRIIYNFPLSSAQEQGYFKKIHFVEVFEPDSSASDEKIAEAAVGRLREDLTAGLSHILMARASKIEKATQLLNDIYSRYADLNPVVIHSKTSKKSLVLQKIREGHHKIVVCVDMFGEGFDLPNLKIAALHDVHKSIGITLQYIGRFARTAVGVGAATFVANTAEDGVPEALESLYREDADWNMLLADLSFDAINPQAQLSDCAPAQNQCASLSNQRVFPGTLRECLSAQAAYLSAANKSAGQLSGSRGQSEGKP
jgi:superfamily II DNA or RNA helicase